MSELFRPMVDWELRTLIAQLLEKRATIEIIGSGSKRGIGRPVEASAILSTAGLKGISLYEPNELVMSARAGTLVSQIESELASHGQMLAFEPLDYGPLLGLPAGLQTLGSVFATNNSGPRRITVGAARDHLLGLSGVNGRAEYFKSGGRVMKNVTGYDVARGLIGSWGTLAVFTELTFKVFPMPQDTRTLMFSDLEQTLAIELMKSALMTPYEISGAVHLCANHAGNINFGSVNQEKRSLTLLRIENFTKSVSYRKNKLLEHLSAYGRPFELDRQTSLSVWENLKKIAQIKSAQTTVWRVSTSPSKAAELLLALRRHISNIDISLDWGGGLIWLEIPSCEDAQAAIIRRAVTAFGGHATLIRAEEKIRRRIEPFQPINSKLMHLSQGLKNAFDPHRLLNPGRMYAAF